MDKIKIVCIRSYSKYLTEGKIYTATIGITGEHDFYWVSDYDGYENYSDNIIKDKGFLKSAFLTLPEYRDREINNILKDY